MLKTFQELPQEVKEKFVDLTLRLEPERLYQDGERDGQEAQEEANRIMREWVSLEKKYQTPVSEADVESVMDEVMKRRLEELKNRAREMRKDT